LYKQHGNDKPEKTTAGTARYGKTFGHRNRHPQDAPSVNSDPQEPPSFLPSAPLENLRRRADLLRRVRAFFDERGFLEVTTPAISADTMIDPHIEPLRVTMFRDPRSIEAGPTWFLQSSPEFHMKRLLAAGAQAIFQIGPAFRACESGPLHNVEFTMVEWYRCGDDMNSGMRLLADLAAKLLNANDVGRVPYEDVFREALDVNPHVVATARLRELASHLRSPSPDDSRDDLLNLLWSESVEPCLGKEDPVIVYDYPASQAALARIRPGVYPVAERFELYFRGVELANGYHELTDPEEFRQRIVSTNTQRKKSGKPSLPVDNRLLNALKSGIPPTTGVAMGFDRVLMLAIGEEKIGRVLSFSSERA